jgi:hypothetical protein
MFPRSRSPVSLRRFNPGALPKVHHRRTRSELGPPLLIWNGFQTRYRQILWMSRVALGGVP